VAKVVSTECLLRLRQSDDLSVTCHIVLSETAIDPFRDDFTLERDDSRERILAFMNRDA